MVDSFFFTLRLDDVMQIRPVMQILAIAAIVLGLTASAAWAGFLGFELFRMIGLL